MSNTPKESFPVVRLELESMRHSILHAFSETQLKTDELVKAVVSRVCTPEYIEQKLQTEVYRALDDAISKEVDRFFRYTSEGQEIVQKAVKEKILTNQTYTPLDE